MLTQIFLSLLFRSLNETKYFHLLFIAGLTCTLSFSSSLCRLISPCSFQTVVKVTVKLNLKNYLIIIMINICKNR